MKQIKQIILTGILLFCIAPALLAQVKKRTAPVNVKEIGVSDQLQNFWRLVAQANVSFIFPTAFKEIKAPSDKNFPFDYAMELPGKEFEIWLQVRSQKQNLYNYARKVGYKKSRLVHPDSLYLDMGTTQATAFTGDDNYSTRSIPPTVAARYNATAGKSYLLSLLDLPITRHYKYALLITLEKDEAGTILAVCFSNERGPELFKNIDKASNCIKFK